MGGKKGLGREKSEVKKMRKFISNLHRLSGDESLSKTWKIVPEFWKGKQGNRDENDYFHVCLYIGEEIAVH